jgi:hypothetical protein
MAVRVFDTQEAHKATSRLQVLRRWAHLRPNADGKKPPSVNGLLERVVTSAGFQISTSTISGTPSPHDSGVFSKPLPLCQDLKIFFSSSATYPARPVTHRRPVHLTHANLVLRSRCRIIENVASTLLRWCRITLSNPWCGMYDSGESFL